MLITNEELTAMQAVIDAATPGPAEYWIQYHGHNDVNWRVDAAKMLAEFETEEDAKAYIQSRTDWPQCIEALREANDKLETIIEILGNYHPDALETVEYMLAQAGKKAEKNDDNQR